MKRLLWQLTGVAATAIAQATAAGNSVACVATIDNIDNKPEWREFTMQLHAITRQLTLPLSHEMRNVTPATNNGAICVCVQEGEREMEGQLARHVVFMCSHITLRVCCLLRRLFLATSV